MRKSLQSIQSHPPGPMPIPQPPIYNSPFQGSPGYPAPGMYNPYVYPLPPNDLPPRYDAPPPLPPQPIPQSPVIQRPIPQPTQPSEPIVMFKKAQDHSPSHETGLKTFKTSSLLSDDNEEKKAQEQSYRINPKAQENSKNKQNDDEPIKVEYKPISSLPKSDYGSSKFKQPIDYQRNRKKERFYKGYTIFYIVHLKSLLISSSEATSAGVFLFLSLAYLFAPWESKYLIILVSPRLEAI